MKVVAFNGSPRADGNTAILIRRALKELETEGIETEFIQLGGHQIHGCMACGTCRKLKNKQCKIVNDNINLYIQKMAEADGIILGSPTYFSMMTPELKALIDRAGYVAMGNDYMFKRKVGAAVVAVRRAGAMPTFDAINHFFLISQMIIPGSSYWNIGIGRAKGDVNNDEEGLDTMTTLGKNMAWLLKQLKPSDTPAASHPSFFSQA
ncbi:MAG TPA: flavodoxin family protein [Candidatus Acidoferrales bacterium]|nr:flavodoxin family protein [Candidatus Acidoferrales bacterium]